MDFEKKLKKRLYRAVIMTVIGLSMIILSFAVETDNRMLSPLGLSITVVGIVFVRNYFLITKSGETIKKQQIIENDERNIFIYNKAKSTAFAVSVLIFGILVIVLEIFGMHDTAKWFSYPMALMLIVYLICYIIYSKTM